MATFNDGIMGGFRGRLGTVVGYQWRGRWCMRARVEPRNPRSERQQAHRSLFKQQVQLASRLNWVLREALQAPSLQRGMTPCNYFVHRNQQAFSQADGRLEVDWSALVLSEGPVAPVQFGVPQVSDETTLTIAFERNPLHVRADKYDRVYLFVYAPEVEVGFLSAPVYRRSGLLQAVLPEVMAGCEVQLWGLVQDAQGRWSETLYVGYGPLVPETESADGVNLAVPSEDTADAPATASAADPGKPGINGTKQPATAPSWPPGTEERRI